MYARQQFLLPISKENCVDLHLILWYYVSIYSCSKGEARMTKEEVLIAIDSEAVEAARAEALDEASSVCSRSRSSRRRVRIRGFASASLFTGSPPGQATTRGEHYLLHRGRSPCRCPLQRG